MSIERRLLFDIHTIFVKSDMDSAATRESRWAYLHGRVEQYFAEHPWATSSESDDIAVASNERDGDQEPPTAMVEAPEQTPEEAQLAPGGSVTPRIDIMFGDGSREMVVGREIVREIVREISGAILGADVDLDANIPADIPEEYSPSDGANDAPPRESRRNGRRRDVRGEILQALKTGGLMSASELIAATGASSSTVYRRVVEMIPDDLYRETSERGFVYRLRTGATR